MFYQKSQTEVCKLDSDISPFIGTLYTFAGGPATAGRIGAYDGVCGSALYDGKLVN